MVAISTWFSLGAVGMVAGTLALAVGYRLIDRKDWVEYSILVAVPGIAMVAYALMAVGVGSIETQGGNTVYIVRYIDWLLTTPLHVLYLGLIAGAAMGTIYRSLGLMAATILLGLGGALVAPPVSLGLFALGSVAFMGVIYYAYDDFDTAAQEQENTTLATFRKLRAFTFVLWLIYPVIWLLGPAGFGFMNIETTALVVSYIDVVAKVGFGFIALSGYLMLGETTDTSATPAD